MTTCSEGDSSIPSSLAELTDWVVPEYKMSAQKLWNEIETERDSMSLRMYADNYTRDYYSAHQPLVWLTPMGIDERADTLLSFLQEVENMGLDKNFFSLADIRNLTKQVRECSFEGKDANQLLAQTEFMLTRAYLRYACGQRYGFTQPNALFNRLLVDIPAPGEARKTTRYRRIFDLPAEEPTDSFARHALMQVREHRVGDFLREVQPKNKAYVQLQKEYERAKSKGESERARLARVNMERARWSYAHPDTGKYVWVNVADFMLTVVDTKRDTSLTMRVCAGNMSHKTPLLKSEIKWMELNPYWVIPHTIVRKEIMPRHVGDSAYYARNRYVAINKETKEQCDPSLLSAEDLRSARYTLRQENGAGNSLGRIIFRFPNRFSVYLHDTNNRSAFNREVRAVSHGCVRLERPLDLAIFLLDNPSLTEIDRIRVAIDKEPLTVAGRSYRQQMAGKRKTMRTIHLPTPVPVWLEYWTLCPDTQGQLQTHPDNYGYDNVIEKALDRL